MLFWMTLCPCRVLESMGLIALPAGIFDSLSNLERLWATHSLWSFVYANKEWTLFQSCGSRMLWTCIYINIAWKHLSMRKEIFIKLPFLNDVSSSIYYTSKQSMPSKMTVANLWPNTTHEAVDMKIIMILVSNPSAYAQYHLKDTKSYSCKHVYSSIFFLDSLQTKCTLFMFQN